jgi:hypothetical protein
MDLRQKTTTAVSLTLSQPDPCTRAPNLFERQFHRIIHCLLVHAYNLYAAIYQCTIITI